MVRYSNTLQRAVRYAMRSVVRWVLRRIRYGAVRMRRTVRYTNGVETPLHGMHDGTMRYTAHVYVYGAACGEVNAMRCM